MKNIARSTSSAAGVLSIVFALMMGFAVPATAIDYAEPPSLTSLKMTSPSIRYPGDGVAVQWAAPANTKRGTLVFGNSWGNQVHIYLERWNDNEASGGISAKSVPGDYKLHYVSAASDYGSVTYYPDGYVSKSPSGLRDPAPAPFDFASFSFRVDELRNFANASELTISGSLTVGQTIEAVLPLEPAATSVEYLWTHEGAPYTWIGPHESTYVLRPEDMGKRIVLRVHANRHGYVSYVKDSQPSEPVLGLITSSAPATIGGKADVGQTLTANPGR